MGDKGMAADELVFPGLDGGYVAAVAEAAGAGLAEGAGAGIAGDAVAGADGEGQEAEGFITAAQALTQNRSNLRWTEPMSAFMLRQMCPFPMMLVSISLSTCPLPAMLFSLQCAYVHCL